MSDVAIELFSSLSATPLPAELWPFGNDALIPLDRWLEFVIVDIIVQYCRPFFQVLSDSIRIVLNGIQWFFVDAVHPLTLLMGLLTIAWQIAGRNTAIFSVVAMAVVGAIGAWDDAMVTLSLILTAVILCAVVGIPLGIWTASNKHAERAARPVLDAMQTLPAFVYLVPVVMLFGTGEVPGTIVTFVFAVPPLIRLTNIGIRGVPSDVVEASRAFGATPRQTLWQVQVPLAMPTILAGINQSLMLALSMVVIASLIAVGGLGQMVNRGIGRLDIGLAGVGGISIVILAIVLDRITQALGNAGADALPWKERGPLGALRKLFTGRRSPAATS
ncbi:ABC-type proline/glycine betaine transport system, permease component [Rubidibacter lacunae KORDI 51-2]|uniref:ABC-type proline/glycine betaine transport system, permease component n=1 Tax=Rubidibacter lacunae KORDI 51-2 TaxID=582515 RepID=U5DEU6_9CHRO|nr:ABC transporter permease subunit [Rubidibacter lacunae]ERN40111.1 ABC-type proline/glycine betaine transport system, permease component [Rubidibacter lacunae KORDI 51-2]